jgi:predicted DsbA family dithiol-disulfide isomerase
VIDQKLLIEIYSDVICPWCFVGKRRLEQALNQRQDAVKPRIIWRPFQLNPTMPTEGIARISYLEAKFGSLALFSQMEEQLLVVGEEERIPFAFGKIARTPNTFLAHRVIWYAEQRDCQDAVVEQLFKGYFEEGLDIGSSSVLIELADRAGLKVASFLESDAGIADVKAEESVGHRLGIRGVPYFVLNQAHAVSGAQPPAVFLEALKKAEADSLGRKAGE